MIFIDRSIPKGVAEALERYEIRAYA